MRSDDDTELLAAYVDGIAELAPDERKRVEAMLATSTEARADEAATRAVLGKLRELPPPGGEPDWNALERGIHAAVGAEVPRPWWRIGWRWLAPGAVMVGAAAAFVLWIHQPAVREARETARPIETPTPTAIAVHQPAEGPAHLPLWLDDHEVDVDPSASEALGLSGDDLDDLDPTDVLGSAPDDLFPAADLAWVDDLDAAAIDRAERWFVGKKKS